MFGSLLGNLAGILYFISFQILGILLALLLFKKEKLCLTLLFGSTIGSFSLQWLPVLYAFFFTFSVRAHIFALFTMILLVFVFYYFSKNKSFLNGRKSPKASTDLQSPTFPTFITACSGKTIKSLFQKFPK